MVKGNLIGNIYSSANLDEGYLSKLRRLAGNRSNLQVEKCDPQNFKDS